MAPDSHRLASGDDYERDHETKAERLDRNWAELLQELRVSQTGVQILTGFLLIVPLQPKFDDLTAFQRQSYVAAVSFCILAVCLLIAPVSTHRLLFGQRRKESIVRVGSVLALSGLATLAVGVTGVVTLVFAVVLGDRGGLAAGAVALLLFGSTWLALPLAMRRGSRPG
jgi:hypothetical protein